MIGGSSTFATPTTTTLCIKWCSWQERSGKLKSIWNRRPRTRSNGSSTARATTRQAGVQRTIRRQSDMQFQNYHLEDLGSGESEDVSLAFAPRETLVQRSPSKKRMDEWLFLPHVSAQPGDLAAPDLGMSSGNAGLEHRGLLDGVQLIEPASVE